MYTTLSPCDMCTGACILYKVSRVVMGENKTFVGGEAHLKQRGIEVVNLENAECEELMRTFVREHPEEWWVFVFVFCRCVQVVEDADGVSCREVGTRISVPSDRSRGRRPPGRQAGR